MPISFLALSTPRMVPGADSAGAVATTGPEIMYSTSPPKSLDVTDPVEDEEKNRVWEAVKVVDQFGEDSRGGICAEAAYVKIWRSEEEQRD
ncbi:hypothetical protein LWI28_018602 [Acer negundo]|uniref:Uncharacterized protein n=1 Tax=Acer negundo TaxID=4023 RepID=A0AAD5IUT3_ACENE|nr:hypothetical protein LWI28_018602 [Acer negundo]